MWLVGALGRVSPPMIAGGDLGTLWRGGGGALGFERAPTPNHTRRAEAANAQIYGRLTPLGGKRAVSYKLRTYIKGVVAYK